MSEKQQVNTDRVLSHTLENRLLPDARHVLQLIIHNSHECPALSVSSCGARRHTDTQRQEGPAWWMRDICSATRCTTLLLEQCAVACEGRARLSVCLPICLSASLLLRQDDTEPDESHSLPGSGGIS